MVARMCQYWQQSYLFLMSCLCLNIRGLFLGCAAVSWRHQWTWCWAGRGIHIQRPYCWEWRSTAGRVTGGPHLLAAQLADIKMRFMTLFYQQQPLKQTYEIFLMVCHVSMHFHYDPDSPLQSLWDYHPVDHLCKLCGFSCVLAHAWRRQ